MPRAWPMARALNYSRSFKTCSENTKKCCFIFTVLRTDTVPTLPCQYKSVLPPNLFPHLVKDWLLEYAAKLKFAQTTFRVFQCYKGSLGVQDRGINSKFYIRMWSCDMPFNTVISNRIWEWIQNYLKGMYRSLVINYSVILFNWSSLCIFLTKAAL